MTASTQGLRYALAREALRRAEAAPAPELPVDPAPVPSPPTSTASDELPDPPVV